MTYIMPDYLNMDFNTFKQKVIDSLQETDTFKDYNFEGSNITVLIELIAYLSELNTYYLNRISKNLYFDSVDMYENANRLANFIGYSPKGSIGSTTTLTMDISASSDMIGKSFTVKPYKVFSSSEVTNDGDTIYFVTLSDTTFTVNNEGSNIVNIPVKQGEISNISYKGSDIIDNLIYLPFEDFGYDDDLNDNEETIVLLVDNGTEETVWTRVSSFFDSSSPVSNVETVYQFKYNKDKQYVIEFSGLKSVPSSTDDVNIMLVKTLGSNGNVAKNTITNLESENYIYNNTDNEWFPDDDILSVTNSSTSSGGKDAETIDELKISAKNILNSQYRAVNSSDYRSLFKLKSNVQEAFTWGEQEENPITGNTIDYNKVYCSIIPTGDVSTWTDIPVTSLTTENNTTLYFPMEYSSEYITDLMEWIEPYKLITTYEEYVLPELIYLAFNFSINVKRMYSFYNVYIDVKNKLNYYFNSINRSFNETIDLIDIKTYLLDSTEIDADGNTFSNVKGINNIEIRDIKFYSVSDNSFINPYEYDSLIYPRFSNNVNSSWDENKIRNISLGFNQFPLIDINSCIFEEE